MAILTRQGGVWKDSSPMVKDGGVWKPVKEGYVKDGGVWKKFHSNGVDFLITSGGYGTPGEYADYVRGLRGNQKPVYGTISPDDPDQLRIIDLYEYYYYAPDDGRTMIEITNTTNLNGKTMVINGHPFVLSGTFSGTTFKMESRWNYLWSVAGATTIGAQYKVSILL